MFILHFDIIQTFIDGLCYLLAFHLSKFNMSLNMYFPIHTSNTSFQVFQYCNIRICLNKICLFQVLEQYIDTNLNK